MSANYAKTSPYYKTGLYGSFLDVMSPRLINKNSSDVSFVINKTYENRPDLLAYDLYGDAALWWVFAARNPNVIKDPVFGFQVGIEIYIPKKTTLVTDLGL